jgi:hypothetical protein
MFIFMVILTGLSLWAVIASVVSVTNDGYRRVPTRTDTAYARESVRKAPHEHRRVLHG